MCKHSEWHACVSLFFCLITKVNPKSFVSNFWGALHLIYKKRSKLTHFILHYAKKLKNAIFCTNKILRLLYFYNCFSAQKLYFVNKKLTLCYKWILPFLQAALDCKKCCFYKKNTFHNLFIKNICTIESFFCTFAANLTFKSKILHINFTFKS